MKIKWSKKADEDLEFFQKSGNKAILKKIELLLEDIIKTPFSGIGKPEALKYQHLGKYSRRIDSKNRLIYKVEKEVIYIYRLKGHYED